jgi:hypothetical protein
LLTNVSDKIIIFYLGLEAKPGEIFG